MSTDNTDEVVYDEYGFDENGIHRDTGTPFDPLGWDRDWIHRDTGTEFHPRTHRTFEGDLYDVNGYDHEGYDSEGYDSDGEDRSGNTRCDNGDCDDPDCEQCGRSGFEHYLMSYDTAAIHECNWRCDHDDRTLYAGHEFEMYSDHVSTDDVDFVLSQLGRAYQQHMQKGAPTVGRILHRCAIAKYDGSLNVEDGGFEVSTIPFDREQTYAIFKSFKTLGDGRCSAWDRGDDIGHHIHVSKAAIGPLTLGKLGVFMNCPENRAFLELIAGRSADYNGFENKKKLTHLRNRTRHSVLNVTDETVEFRLFKCNLYSRAILKNYEFAVAAVAFCEQASHGMGNTFDPDAPLHWWQFRQYVAVHRGEYPFLHEFMLTHPTIGLGYRNNCGLPQSVVAPSDKSPKFALLRMTRITGA